MELPHVGQVCVICRRNDYLPFKCSHCDKIVCIDHKSDHGSECPLNITQFETGTTCQPSGLKQSCDHCKKITLKLELVACHLCNGLHCLYHRHPVQHDCIKFAETKESQRRTIEERSERQRAALDKLKESCRSTTAANPVSYKPSQPLDLKKQELAKRIRVMKIKQSARGPPNILQEDKIYFQIRFVHQPSSPLSDVNLDGKTIKIFTTLKHTVGRMIDWSADELGVKNKNHIQEASQLVFEKQLDNNEPLVFDSQLSFGKYFEDSKIDNGDEIILTYTKS